MSDAKKPKHVFKERSKIGQVTHWDMDYLPKNEIEALYATQAPPPPRDRTDPKPRTNTRLALILVGIGVLLLLISLGLAARL